MLNVLDIFSGIGGFSIGLEAIGMKTVAFCEINPFCQKILTRHWPSVPIFFDITVIDKEDLKALPPIHVIAGGFPCQDISVAGKGGGINAKRSGLWKEFVRLINEVRPKYAIIENVANLRSQGLTRVLQDLWEIGYDAEWHCIPASAFGAPHRRDRIWIIATPLASAKSDCPSERRRQSPHLEAVVKMLPTPTARDYKDVGDLKKLAQYAHKSRLACTIAAEALSNGEKSLQKYQD